MEERYDGAKSNDAGGYNTTIAREALCSNMATSALNEK